MLRQSAAAAIWLLFYLCPLSQSTAQGVSRQCYEVKNETVCYFQPADGVAMTWDDADKLCRDNNATLPVIPNIDYQRTIEMYFTQILKQKNVVVFTAGRKSWSLDPNYPWRWVNGKPARTVTIPLITATSVFEEFEDGFFGCIYPGFIMFSMIRANGVDSCRSFPRPFICQYFESICKTLKTATYHLHDRTNCFVIYDKALSWYEARNKCIEGGGDLAIFDDVDSFMAFRNFTSALNNHRMLFIGLQRNWWTWRARESFDIKYTNWPQFVGQSYYDYVPEDVSGLECLCLNGGNNFKWTSCNCSEGRHFFCQSATKVTSRREHLEEGNKSNSLTYKFSNASRCYDVSGSQVCYFTPENATRLDFVSANRWCRDHNATLTIISSKIHQKNLESFLETISLPIYLLWTSGLKVKTGGWSWINGHPLRESDIGDLPQFVSFHVRTRSKETLEQKGQLWRSLSYDKKPKSSNTGYVCQFPGDSCKAFNSGIRGKNGECLVVNEEHVSWYEARNRCIDDGGDLATFEDVSKIEILASYLTSDKSYHIGLENSRWVWNQSDKLEDCVQYNNWNGTLSAVDGDDFQCHCHIFEYGYDFSCELKQCYSCLCLETFTYKWIPCDCDLTFRFVCQRVESNNGSESSFQLNKTDTQNVMCSSESNQGFIIAGVEGLIIAVLAIAFISLAIRFRKKNETVVNSALEMQATTDEGYISVNPTIESNPSEYQDLKLYEEVR